MRLALLWLWLVTWSFVPVSAYFDGWKKKDWFMPIALFLLGCVPAVALWCPK